jgi:hypothetical protein
MKRRQRQRRREVKEDRMEVNEGGKSGMKVKE